MKKGFKAAAAIVLFSATAALAQDTKKEQNLKDPMAALSDSYDLIADGKYDEATAKLIWCFDTGPTIEPAFSPVKSTCVVDALATCAEAWPASAQLIRAKRDAKMTELGDKPDFKSPVLHDVLLLNIVLADFGKNQELVQYAAKEGTIKKFSSAGPPPPIPTFESAKVDTRVKSAVQYLSATDDIEAKKYIEAALGRCGNETIIVKEEKTVIIKEIDTLNAKLKAATTTAEKGKLASAISAKIFTLENVVKPMEKDLGFEKEYYAKLMEWHVAIP